MNKKLASKIKTLPQKPGVYIFRDKAGRILYIGKAVNLRSRVRSHFKVLPSFLKEGKGGFKSPRPPSLRSDVSGRASIPLYKGGSGFMNQIADIDFIKTADEKEALILENQLIKKYQPRYNIQWRDDKSYFWVSFTDEQWPRVQVNHQKTLIRHAELVSASQKKQILKQVQDDISLKPIGPFVNGKELRRVLRALRKILPYRTCKNAFDKPCLQWHLGLCPAHGKNPPQPSLKGGSGSPPLGGVRGDFKKQLNLYNNSLDTLSQVLRLYAGDATRIEAYDISNIHGAYATGSMIVFAGSKPKKSDYRRFRIKDKNSYGRIRVSRGPQSGTNERFSHAANDVAMLKEIIRRRLNHSEWPRPDLILIDGGKPQLSAARRALAASRYSLVPIFALAKRVDELYTIYSDRTLRLSALPLSLRLTFQAIRNEAHRFAIFYYRKLHRKTITK